MTKKEKQRKNQKRKMKQGQKDKQRTKKVLHQKHIAKKPKKIITKQNVNKTIGDLPLKVRIKIGINTIKRKILRAGCFIGFHDWKLCSGIEKDPMYVCMNCWKKSKKLWGKGGSTEYYDKKYEKVEGISDPKNWDKKDGDWYFKGRYIELDKEARRRLKVILKKNEK